MPVEELRVWRRIPQGSTEEGCYPNPVVRVADGVNETTLLDSRLFTLLRLGLEEAPSHHYITNKMFKQRACYYNTTSVLEQN